MTHQQILRILHAAIGDVRKRYDQYSDLCALYRATLYVACLVGRLTAQGNFGDAEARELAKAISTEILDIDNVLATQASDGDEGRTA